MQQNLLVHKNLGSLGWTLLCICASYVALLVNIDHSSGLW